MKKYLLSLLFLGVSSWCMFPTHAVAADEKGTAQNSGSAAAAKSGPLVPVFEEEDKKPEPDANRGLLKVEEIDEPLERLESQNPLDPASPLPIPAAEQNVPAKYTAPDALTESTEIPIGKIQITEMKLETASIELHAGERIDDYKVFTLTAPSRLVIEISSAVYRPGTDTIVINKFGFSTARIEHHPKYLRIFLDAEYGRIIPYRIEETDASLNILFPSLAD